VRRMVAAAVEAFGELNVIFNNAGMNRPRDFMDVDEANFEEIVRVNTWGVIVCTQEAARQMIAQGSGSIVHCASGWGLVGGPKAAAYCAAKGGMVVMTKAMAIDHGPQGIRVNAICPGDTDTPMEREDARNQGLSWEAYVHQMTGTRPIARMATAEEIALGVLFLASDDASYITGAALPVDGGGVAD